MYMYSQQFLWEVKLKNFLQFDIYLINVSNVGNYCYLFSKNDEKHILPKFVLFPYLIYSLE